LGRLEAYQEAIECGNFELAKKFEDQFKAANATVATAASQWYENFKQLPAEEQARMISSFATTLVVGKPIAGLQMKILGAGMSGLGRGASVVAEKMGEALKVEPAAVAMTPEGIGFAVKATEGFETASKKEGATVDLCEANSVGRGVKISYQKKRPIIWRDAESGAQVKLKMDAKIVNAFEKYGVKNIGELKEGVPTIEATAVKGAELTGPIVQTFEQARNIALEIVGDMGPNSKQLVGDMEISDPMVKLLEESMQRIN